MRYLSIFLLACAAPGSTLTTSDDVRAQSAAIVDNVVTLTEDVTVDADSVTLPASSFTRVKAGDYIVSAQGDGFLRKVERVDGVKLYTKLAALTEVVIRANIDTTLPLDPITVDASGTLGNDGLSLTPMALSLRPTVRLKLQIEDHQVKVFSTSVQMGRDVQVGGVLDLPGPGEYTTGDLKIYTSPKWRFTQWIGPVPLVEVVSLDVKGGVTANVSASVKANVQTECSHEGTFGVSYAGGNWDTQNDDLGGCDSPVPEYNVAARVALQPYVQGVLAVDFYGVAGPYLALRDGLRADIAVCPSPAQINLEMPLGVVLGADLSRIGLKKFEKTLAEVSFPIHAWSVDSSKLCP